MSSCVSTLPVASAVSRRAVMVSLFLWALVMTGSLPAFAQEALRIAKEPAGISVRSGERLVLQYQDTPQPMKPYIKQWLTPAGVSALRDSPFDHKHHHALMFAVAVDGVNFWEEREMSGSQKPRSLSGMKTYTRAGLDWATFTQAIDWTAPKSDAVMLKERRRIDACRVPEPAVSLLIWRCKLEPPPGKESVTLGGATYFGLGVRFVQSMDTGGRFINADGKTGVQETNAARSAWCAYSAAADGKPVTVAMFDHPANPRHPATWFTMDSGFAYLSATLDLSKQPLVVESKKPLELTYGMALWDGQVEAEQIEKLYRRLLAWAAEEAPR